MRLLVTGCAGFIGSEVCRLALRRGHAVTGVDNVNDAYDVRLKRWRLRQLQATRSFRFLKADITQARPMREAFTVARPDVVLNLAARAGVRESLKDPQSYVDTNITGTLTLLEAARKADVGRFVLASSSSLYGSHNRRPFRETANTDRPLSPYAATKKAAEALLATYNHLYGINGAALRYFTVYGPAGRPDMSIFRFVRWILEGEPVTVYGDGNQERDFTYVEDIARGTLAAMAVRGFHIINLGNDRPVTLRNVIRNVERVARRPARIDRRPAHPADIRATWANIDYARKTLGWKPRVPLEQGLARCVQWYIDHRKWARTISTQ